MGTIVVYHFRKVPRAHATSAFRFKGLQEKGESLQEKGDSLQEKGLQEKGVGLQDASENPRPATAKIGVFSLKGVGLRDERCK